MSIDSDFDADALAVATACSPSGPAPRSCRRTGRRRGLTVHQLAARNPMGAVGNNLHEAPFRNAFSAAASSAPSSPRGKQRLTRRGAAHAANVARAATVARRAKRGPWQKSSARKWTKILI
jgi:hypothetical protein